VVYVRFKGWSSVAVFVPWLLTCKCVHVCTHLRVLLAIRLNQDLRRLSRADGELKKAQEAAERGGSRPSRATEASTQ
jgi:hypothetical protein